MTLSFEIILLILGSVLGTAFLSGIFGMAGGIILKGILVSVMTVSGAMVLHGLVQIVSNGWRAVLWRRDINWPVVWRFGVGIIPVTIIFAWAEINPPAVLVFFGLGIIPFANELIPKNRAPVIDQPYVAYFVGALVTFVQLLAGVAGPFLDVFFVRAKMTRQQIVATKATTQVMGHCAKVGQFGFVLSGLTDDRSFPLWLPLAAVPLSILGTSLAAPVLSRISDKWFRNGMRILLLTTGTVYLLRAASLAWLN
jgi:uncharacterized membrane protein YfcA